MHRSLGRRILSLLCAGLILFLCLFLYACDARQEGAAKDVSGSTLRTEAANEQLPDVVTLSPADRSNASDSSSAVTTTLVGESTHKRVVITGPEFWDDKHATATTAAMPDFNALLVALQAAGQENGIAPNPRAMYIPALLRDVQASVPLAVYPSNSEAIEYYMPQAIVSRSSGVRYEPFTTSVGTLAPGQTKKMYFDGIVANLGTKPSRYTFQGDEYLFLFMPNEANEQGYVYLIRSVMQLPDVVCGYLGVASNPGGSIEAFAEKVYLDFECYALKG
jgi:hypothetical protein